jgi:hypothetical protein
VLVWAMPGFAAQTFTVPFTVVPGSVSVKNPQTGLFEPVSMPFSKVIQSNNPNCTFGLGTFSAEMVNGGIEVELEGTAVSNGVGDCGLSVNARLTVEFDVPELGGTVTMRRIDTTAIEGTFSELHTAFGRFGVTDETTSSIPGGKFSSGSGMSGAWKWSASGSSDESNYTLHPYVPGDTVQSPSQIGLSFAGAVPANGTATQGTIRIRYEFKTTYAPEPSAALSLPIGVLGLLGLASLRG